MDPDEMSNLYRGLSIDVSHHVSVHLAKRLQRRIFKIDQSETSIWQGELKMMTIRETWGGEHLWKDHYQDCTYRPDPLTNMATTGNTCF
jgi:hypothetical protein